MNKPVIFISHSSVDKKELSELKETLLCITDANQGLKKNNK